MIIITEDDTGHWVVRHEKFEWHGNARVLDSIPLREAVRLVEKYELESEKAA